jgi:hypothetical protein
VGSDHRNSTFSFRVPWSLIHHGNPSVGIAAVNEATVVRMDQAEPAAVTRNTKRLDDVAYLLLLNFKPIEECKHVSD